MLESVERGLAGWSPATQPGWWLPWDAAHADLKTRAKPLPELIARRPPDAQALLRAAAQAAGADPAKLLYLPLTSSTTKDWVALLDADCGCWGMWRWMGFDCKPNGPSALASQALEAIKIDKSIDPLRRGLQHEMPVDQTGRHCRFHSRQAASPLLSHQWVEASAARSYLSWSLRSPH